MISKRAMLLALAALGLGFAASPVTAQTFPTRPITIVVPFPAGGPVDVVGRLLAERMRESLGQPVLIENVAGASGSIAVGKVARAAGDGYTIVIGNWATFVVNGAIF